MLGLLYVAAVAALSAGCLPGEPLVMFQIFQIACLLYSSALGKKWEKAWNEQQLKYGGSFNLSSVEPSTNN